MNSGIVRDLYDAFGRGDMNAAFELLAEDVEWNYPGRTPLSGQRQGREQVREFFATLNRLARIDRFDLTELIAQGDHVVALGAMRLTIRDTGHHAEQNWAHVYTLRDGKIARADLYEDTDALAAVIGESAAERSAALGPMGVTEPPYSGRTDEP